MLSALSTLPGGECLAGRALDSGFSYRHIVRRTEQGVLSLRGGAGRPEVHPRGESPMTMKPTPFAYVGLAIRLLRSRAHLTQVELGELAEITKSQLSKYERCRQRPSLDTLDRIMIALEVDPFELALVLREVENQVSAKKEKIGGMDEAAHRRLTRQKARTDLVQGFARFLEQLEETVAPDPP